jgi:hypothetical protein
MCAAMRCRSCIVIFQLPCRCCAIRVYRSKRICDCRACAVRGSLRHAGSLQCLPIVFAYHLAISTLDAYSGIATRTFGDYKDSPSSVLMPVIAPRVHRSGPCHLPTLRPWFRGLQKHCKRSKQTTTATKRSLTAAGPTSISSRLHRLNAIGPRGTSSLSNSV